VQLNDPANISALLRLRCDFKRLEPLNSVQFLLEINNENYDLLKISF
jgi:hypothetical protein